jgi:hypothetical protein
MGRGMTWHEAKIESQRVRGWIGDREIGIMETDAARMWVDIARIENPGQTVRLEPIPDTPSVVCPACGRRSFHPQDIAESYCGFCHNWHSEMSGEMRELMIAAMRELQEAKAKGLSFTPRAFEPVEMLALASQLQLALRHPGNDGEPSRVARQLIEEVVCTFAEGGLPTVARLVGLGDDPKFDHFAMQLPDEAGETPGLCQPRKRSPQAQPGAERMSWMGEDGLPMHPEERRFYRLIDERGTNGDGTQDVILACGHASRYVVPIPDSQHYVPCAQCVNEWVEAARSS